jgi:hypothetical protein
MVSSSFKTHQINKRKDDFTAQTILFLCFAAICLLLYGAWELWRSNTYVERHCQVISIEVLIQRKGDWMPAWGIIVLDEADGRRKKVRTQFKSGTSYFLKSSVTNVAETKSVRMFLSDSNRLLFLFVFFFFKKQINHVYPCYRHRSYPSGAAWGWQ